MALVDGRPDYAQLPNGRADGVFGEHDQYGTLNLLTPDALTAAARLVTTGKVVSLNASVMDWNRPHVLGDPNRGQTHHQHHRGEFHAEDILGGFNPQDSSQWDHFLHWQDVTTGSFYNGLAFDDSGMHLWSRRGIAGRGVLLDLPRLFEHVGRQWDWLSPIEISVGDLEDCAEFHDIVITPGTILIIRTGWESGYSVLTESERFELSRQPVSFPGLSPSTDMASWLWNNGIAAVASDNPTLELWPMPAPAQMLHTELLGKLGMPIGELWLLDELASVCHDVARFDFLVTSAPLNLPGGVSSPANALALF